MRRPRRHLAGLLAVVCLLAGACVSEPELPRGRPDPLAGAGQGVCGLLTVDEIEVALNVPISGQPRPGSTGAPEGETTGDEGRSPQGTEGARPVLPGMEMCSVGSTTDGVAWGRVEDPVGEVPAGELFERYARWNEDHVERVQVDGRDSVWDPALTTLVVLDEDDILAIRLATADGEVGKGGRAVTCRRAFYEAPSEATCETAHPARNPRREDRAAVTVEELASIALTRLR